MRSARIPHETSESRPQAAAREQGNPGLWSVRPLLHGRQPALFPSPNPPLAQLDADLVALDVAEAEVKTRTKGAREARDAKLEIVLQDLESARAYVQGVANQNPANAAAIIESGGMTSRKFTMRQLGELVVRQGKVSGSVRLVTMAAGDRASYEWEHGAGLVPGTQYFFRVRPVTKDGPRTWSQIVSLIVT